MSVQRNGSQAKDTRNGRLLWNVVLKALALFLLANLVHALLNPLPTLGRISLYNHLFPGRLRLPYSDAPALSYNLSLNQIEALFASHEISAGEKAPDEYRVLLIGDSSVWGFLLPPDQTTSGLITSSRLTAPDGRRVHVYNLGYPIMSLLKDVMILEQALKYRPDMVVWLVTLESVPYDKQFSSPLLQKNAPRAQSLIAAYDLHLDAQDPSLMTPTFWDRTIVGQRRDLADLIRLQLYGFLWGATGIDHYLPEEFELRAEDLEADASFHGLEPPQALEPTLAADVLQAGASLVGDVPLLLINQPMFISQGENSDIRYNFHYPRWAYDAYRHWFADQCKANAWHCVDLWDAIQPEAFTNTAFHVTPEGSQKLAGLVAQAILDHASLADRP